MDYKPRLICPENGNKYYNRIINNGYSTCIQGNTKTSCYNPNLDTLPNCVGYAMGRFNEIGNYGKFKYAIKGNAEDWYLNAQKLGLEVGSKPKLGAIICWRKGKANNSSDGAGHVAIVEQIYSNYIITSESGWSASKLFWTQKRSGSNWGQSRNYTFQGFIYNPAVDYHKNYLSFGDEGEEVKELQHKLNIFGWYDLREDGSFGPATDKASRDAQVKLGLEPDGLVGPKTKTALDNAIKTLSGTKSIDILFNNKQYNIEAINIDGFNFIKLKDIYWKFNFAEVSFNEDKNIPEVKERK